MKRLLLLSAVLLCVINIHAQNFFKRADENGLTLRQDDERTIIPEKYEFYSLAVNDIRTYLRQAPKEFSGYNGLNIDIPMPDGSLETFAIFDSPVLQKGIAARYPDIKSYKGYSLKNREKNIRFALSNSGFYAAINTLDGEIYIDPYSELVTDHYISYFNSDFNKNIYGDIPMCGITEEWMTPREETGMAENRTDQVQLRVLRLAVACTASWGSVARRGTVEKCLADINAMVTRMNSIYENEIALRFMIIDDNDKIIFLNSANEPYTNTEVGSQILRQNTNVLNSHLPGGANAYDVGHVMSICFDVGGVAFGGSACQSNKASGVTCNNNNDLSKIVTRVMAHEIGHQFDASHTWNICNPNNASTDNQRAANWAYEPGSGSTIMSYAGSCGADNVVGNNDAYFHVASMFQMYAKTREGGNAFNCSEKITTENHYPTVSVPSVKYTIPILTPFELRGDGDDEDGDVLTYCWEQYELGPKVPLGTVEKTGPIFRSYKPATDGNKRIIPGAANLFAGNLTGGTEALSDIARDLVFRLTVRDNNPEVGGVVWEEYRMSVTDKAGPFSITYPTGGEVFRAGELVNVTWDVANTNKEPIGCQLVNIYGSYLSALKEGDPDLVLLAQNMPNNGAADIVIPDRVNNFFRIVIKAADHIILTASPGPAKILGVDGPLFTVSSKYQSLNLCQPEDRMVAFRTTGLGGFDGDIHFSLENVPTGIIAQLQNETVHSGEYNYVFLSTNGAEENTSGNLVLKAVAEGVDDVVITIPVTVSGVDIDKVEAIYPINNSDNIVSIPTFQWNPKRDAEDYEFQLATNPDFTSNHLIYKEIGKPESFTVESELDTGITYYWRVRANNKCRNGKWSEVNSFRVGEFVCNSYLSGDHQIQWSSENQSALLSIEIPNDGIISDLNIGLIKVLHNNVFDLTATLISPSGTQAILWKRICLERQNVEMGLDDQADKEIECPMNTGKTYRTAVSRGADRLSVFNQENMQGTWTLRIEDDGNEDFGEIQQLNLEFCNKIENYNPFVINNRELKIHPGDKGLIPSALLLVADNNQSADGLEFTLVRNPVAGQLLFKGVQLNVGDTFTQEDIDNNLLQYLAVSNLEIETSFLFTVSNGLGGWIGITEFNISIDEIYTVSTDDNSEITDVFVYPNPTSGVINVMHEPTLDRFQLTDVYGRVLQQGRFNGTHSEIDMSEYRSGMYYLVCSDGVKKVVRKIVRM